jgi:hypothetical protein
LFYLLLALITVVIIILAVILVLPFQIFFKLFLEDKNFHGHVKIKFIGVTLLSKSLTRNDEKKKDGKVKAEEGGSKKLPWDISRILKGFKLFIDALPYLEPILNAFVRSLNLENFKTDLKIGFNSSVDTEFMAGCLWGVSAILKPFPSVQFNVEPVFGGETLNGSANIHIQLRLFRIVFEFLKSLMHKPVRSLIWFAIRSSNSEESKNGIFKGFKRRNSGRSTPES